MEKKKSNAGRPAGSKNKTQMPRIHRTILNTEHNIITTLIAMAKNQVEDLGRKDAIPANVQLQAISKYMELLAEVKELYEEEVPEAAPSGTVTPMFSTKAL